MVISKKPLHFIVALLVSVLPLVAAASNPDSTAVQTVAVHSETEAHHTEEPKDLKTEIKEYINHHLLDSYDFHLFSWEDDSKVAHHIGFPLPVILVDNGVQFFMSSKFHHGETVAESNGNFYKLYHGKIYKTDAEGTIKYDAEHHVTNAKPTIDLSITKNVFMMLVVSLLMLWLFSSLAKSYAKNGGIAKGAGRFFEPIILYIRDDIAIPNIGHKNYKKYMSYLLTIFFFVWFLNMFGLTPLGVNVTGNIAITAGLAILTYLITTFTANKNYWGHIFWMPGVELLGTIIKPFSLMIRLYANIVAGHVVLMSIIGLMFIFKNWLGSSLSFFLAFALSLLEILVAALQAYIFTMLSALYFGAANEEHHHEEGHH
jgi:F-type H+-transporting ATPase subunit a